MSSDVTQTLRMRTSILLPLPWNLHPFSLRGGTGTHRGKRSEGQVRPGSRIGDARLGDLEPRPPPPPKPKDQAYLNSRTHGCES